MKRLKSAVRFVKPGGRIVYVTCSVLRAENEDRVAAFLARHDDFLPVDAATQARAAGLAALAGARLAVRPGLPLEPADDRHGRVLRRDARADLGRLASKRRPGIRPASCRPGRRTGRGRSPTRGRGKR